MIISFKRIFPTAFFNILTEQSTGTNNTSTESSDTQLFGAGKFKGLALSGGIHSHLPQKDIVRTQKKIFDGNKLILIP